MLSNAVAFAPRSVRYFASSAAGSARALSGVRQTNSRASGRSVAIMLA
jgi:hypothetical protein